MTYTNQSIKVRITRESYNLMGNKTKCTLEIRLHLTPGLIYEYNAHGWSKCHGEDAYVESTGKKIAMTRAVTNAYRKAYGYARKHLRRQLMYIDAFNRFSHKLSDVVYGNRRYLERFTDDTKDNKEPEGQKE